MNLVLLGVLFACVKSPSSPSFPVTEISTAYFKEIAPYQVYDYEENPFKDVTMEEIT